MSDTQIDKISEAQKLYDEIIAYEKDLSSIKDIRVLRSLSEKIDDAISLFGTTNQEKKAHLKEIKRKLSHFLPPEKPDEIVQKAFSRFIAPFWSNKLTRIILILIVVGVLAYPAYSIITWYRSSQPPTSQTSQPKETKPNDNVSANQNNESANQNNQSEETKIAATGDNFSPITPKEFFDSISLRNQTTLKREEFIKSFVGKRITWEGKISNISSNFSGDEDIYIHIRVDYNESSNGAIFYFPVSAKQELINLTKGQKIKVSGVFTDMLGEKYPQFNKSLLLKVEPEISAETFEEFLKILNESSLTNVQIQQRYKGKQFVWEGYVNEVETIFKDEVTVSIFSDKDSNKFAFFSFTTDQKDNLLTLKRKQKIRVEGTFKELLARKLIYFTNSKLIQVSESLNH